MKKQSEDIKTTYISRDGRLIQEERQRIITELGRLEAHIDFKDKRWWDGYSSAIDDAIKLIKEMR